MNIVFKNTLAIFLFVFVAAIVAEGHIRKPRMIYAEPTKIEKYPYVAYGGHCTASIIHERYILSAKHCYGSGNPSDISFWIGVDDRNNISAGVQHFAEAYFSASEDAVLFRLSQPIIFNARAQPVKLNQHISFVKDETITVTGFGVTENGGYSQELREGNFTFFRKDNGGYVLIHALSPKNGLATGDSGSPAVVYRFNDCQTNIYQIGIAVGAGTSYQNGTTIYHAFFTAITPSVCEWLKDKSNNEILC